MIILPVLTVSFIPFHLKSWENLLFELGSESWYNNDVEQEWPPGCP